MGSKNIGMPLGYSLLNSGFSEAESICCEAVLLRSIVNVYFLWRPLFTMLYPATNEFLPQFTQRDSWVLRIPLNRQMTPH